MFSGNVLKTQALVQIRFIDLWKVWYCLGKRSHVYFYFTEHQRVNMKHLKNERFPDETNYVFA